MSVCNPPSYEAFSAVQVKYDFDPERLLHAVHKRLTRFDAFSSVSCVHEIRQIESGAHEKYGRLYARVAASPFDAPTWSENSFPKSRGVSIDSLLEIRLAAVATRCCNRRTARWSRLKMSTR
jgi:hypothetical protein